jgi:hypothetical protein
MTIKSLMEQFKKHKPLLYQYIEKNYEKNKILFDNDFWERIYNDEYSASYYWEFLFSQVMMVHNSKMLLEKFSNATKQDNTGPDFKLATNDSTILVECVCPNRGCGDDALIDHPLDVAYFPRHDLVQLRIANSIDNKMEQYNNWRNKKIITGDEPFVIAIGLYGLPQGEVSSFLYCRESVIGSVTAVGWPMITLDRQKIINNGVTATTKVNNLKGNNSPVAKDIFGNPKYANISAVIFSAWADQPFLLCYPDNETPEKFVINNDFILIHNHKAKNPLTHNIFNVPEQHIICEDDEFTTITRKESGN